MNILIDLILAAIVIYCGWRGYKNGILRGVCGILAIVVSLYGANVVASVYSSEFTGVLNPFISGIVDSSVSKVLEYDGKQELEDSDRISFSLKDDDEEEPQRKSRQIIFLTDSEKEDVYKVCYASCRYLGLSDGASETVASRVELSTASVGQNMSADLSDALCERLAFVVTFAVAFTLIAIVFAVIGNIINLTFAIPGAQKVEPYVGIAFGIVKGIMLIMVISVLFRYTGMLISDDTVEKTILLELLIKSNPVAKSIGL